MLVDLSWILSAAALTNGAVFGPKLTDVPVKEEGLKKDFLANPSSGVLMRKFLTAEILAHNGLKDVSTAASDKPKAFVPMKFSDSEDEKDQVEAPAPVKTETELQQDVVTTTMAEILQLELPVNAAGVVVNKGMKKFKNALQKLPETFNAALEQLHALDSDLAAQVDQKVVIVHVKGLKRKVREWDASQA